jgi:small subunit ribosomal protein S8
MSMTDNIADMLTRIRNAQKSKMVSVFVPHSKMKCAILNVLKEEGYIASYKEIEGASNIKGIDVDLKYSAQGKPVIQEIARVSKPGKRAYTHAGMQSHYNGMGIYIISTSKGVLSDRAAHALGVGGEVICKVF